MIKMIYVSTKKDNEKMPAADQCTNDGTDVVVPKGAGTTIDGLIDMGHDKEGNENQTWDEEKMKNT